MVFLTVQIQSSLQAPFTNCGILKLFIQALMSILFGIELLY